ncbi:alpha-glucan family phosphorylase [Microbacterium sp. STN6]|uniref:alpha-glucan family phosphorylase n=1 Tax=Microbacterium sp. STN6 TaxID=2995588 RepID=UPI00226091A4|nr:alpha-glucan family phosphorylase [Microbacterium sp. STN6]MCX7522148.1 alpha-glucan family phosphorylase [Microbacterium sp. STN6]
MKAIRTFTVRAPMPERLAGLAKLAGNLRWSWHEPTARIFAQISPEVWEGSRQDPAAVLASADPSRLAELAADDDFVERVDAQAADLDDYLTKPRWYQTLDTESTPTSIAYFSPEFGIASALPQYSGGLGILAGDHLKSASDLGVPLVGIGLFYRAGYFRQTISAAGWQEESYPALDAAGLPLAEVRETDGSRLRVALALPDGRTLNARILEAAVGRVPLLLLDTDIEDNDADLRDVTDRLYGGQGEHRLRQELLLGVGGVRALAAWCRIRGAEWPEVFHTNEGHAGFQGLERIARLIGDGHAFDEALQLVRASTVFTTHTPVPAGIDRFERSLVETYVSGDMLPGVGAAQVLPLGTEDYEGGSPDVFNMAVMGLRLAQHANGVSRLHGEVSRRMFGGLWPGFDENEVPIDSVTNGVHPPTWTDPMLRALASERLGTSDTSSAPWGSGEVTDAELWEVRGRMRRQLVGDARRRVAAASLERSGIVPAWVDELLDERTLTIGFARRVPTYKRLTLMLHDEERLRAILTDPERPVQLVIAGKAHPEDEEGKRLIQQVVRFAADPVLRTRIVFLPDYDIGMAKKLYPGCDVWLNNPLRPLEACGTSGMKAALNGVLNLSVLDGWWNEFYDGENGWAIPSAVAADAEERDALEAGALYDLIEQHIVPRFYHRDAESVPVRWVQAIRHTLATLSPVLSADRMVREYLERLYRPAAVLSRRLREDDAQPAVALAAWKQRVSAAWPGVEVLDVESSGADDGRLGDKIRVRARVRLGDLAADDVVVQAVYGITGADGLLHDAHVRRLQVVPDSEFPPGSGEFAFEGRLRLRHPGTFGYTVRVLPANELLVSPAEMGLVTLAQ